MRQNLLILMVALTLTACGSTRHDSHALDWPRVNEPAGTDHGLVWADRQTGDIHLADGTTLSGDRSIYYFVAAGQGAYVVDKDDQALVEVTPDGSRETGAHVDKLVKASADGRYLAFLDPRSGPVVQGTPVLEAVVVDLETGKEVARSTQGMGGEDTDDLADLYEDAEYGVLGVTDKKAWFSVPEGDVLAIDLPSGKATTTPDTDTSSDDNPWVNPQLSPPTTGGPANSAETW
jgi:hypothetical protein